MYFSYFAVYWLADNVFLPVRSFFVSVRTTEQMTGGDACPTESLLAGELVQVFSLPTRLGIV